MGAFGACGAVDAGGDVHYVSLCPSCIVPRIALADVSGHGQAVAALGEKLRELVQRHLRELAQVELMREFNQAVAISLSWTAMEPPKRRVRLEMNWVVTDSCASPVVSP